MTADDYFAIQNLLYRYCDCMDRADFRGAAQLFAHAALHVPARAEPVRGVDDIAAMYALFTRVYPDSGTPKTRHVTSNVIIEPEGEQAARAQSYILVHQATEQLPLQPIISGRYYDRFARVGGVWRFSERRMEMDLFGNLSAHLLQPFGPGQRA
jgi:3-phenylpropionate/cinnamic acid dioxygenase small subunit